jgi:serine/threonine protein kinase
LGDGHGGAVFNAYDRMLDQVVAVKLLELPLRDKTAYVEAATRFYAAVQAAAKLTHPCIVPVLDYGESAEHAWIAMELVEGISLKQALERGEHYTMPDILRLMDQILSALEYSHERGVVHCNLKPDSIMLTSTPGTDQITARLTGFGVEANSITLNGAIPGTPAYMAPEQFGGRVDERDDVWAAGVVFYEWLTGQRSFEGDHATVSLKVATVDPPPPSHLTPLPPAVDAIVAKAMAKRLGDRYQSAAEFAAALRVLQLAVSPGVPSVQAASPPLSLQARRGRPALRAEAVGRSSSATERVRRSRRSLYLAFGAGFSVCALIGLVLVGLTLQRAPSRTAWPFSQAAEAVRQTDCALLQIDSADDHIAVRGILRNRSADALRKTVAAYGLPPDSARLEFRTFDADFCDVLRTVRPIAVLGDELPRITLESPDPLPAGKNLRFRVETPGRPTYLHVYFFGSTGQVGNMAQSSQRHRAYSSLDFGESYWTAAPPYGTGLLVAITSDDPLYTNRRGPVERPSDVLAALSDAIETAQRTGKHMGARVITATSVPPL